MISRPTSEELMMFVDGELDPARAAEVQAFIDADPDARATVSALMLAGAMLSDAAMGEAERGGADDIADRVMRRIDAGDAQVADLAVQRARSRRPLAIAAAAWTTLAVAAALTVWVKAPKIQEHLPGPTTMAIGTAAAVRVGAATEVDAVDFGARAGAIFYVPSDGANSTAVVWLTDDDTTGDRR